MLLSTPTVKITVARRTSAVRQQEKIASAYKYNTTSVRTPGVFLPSQCLYIF
jgi:hypothetical protein